MPKRAEIVGLYPETGWDYDKIEAILRSHTSIKEYILALHDQDVDGDGNPMKPHHHVYLNFGNTNWKYEDIAKWFGIPSNMVGKIEADPQDKHPIIGQYAVIRYYTHAAYPDKHFYPISSFRTNIKDIEEFYARQQEAALNRAKTGHQDSQLNDFIERCSTGEIMPYNYWEHIPSLLYSQNANLFKNAWSIYHDTRIAKAKGNWDCQIIWLYGEKGTGKTSLGKLYAQQMELPLYITHPGNDPMGSYLDQPIILLDELRPKEGFTYKELLQFLDPYTQTATKSRYFDKIAMADYIIVTSVYSPMAYYKAVMPAASDIDSAGQLYRRISQVWHVTNDSIQASRYDLPSDRFLSLSVRKNPLADYLNGLALTRDAKHPDPLDVLGKIAEKYDPALAQMSLFAPDGEQPAKAG